MVELIKNIAIAIRDLHKHGLVHLNLSLTNIGLKKRENEQTYYPQIYNLDWTVPEEAIVYNREMGNNIFKAPEFINGEGKYSAAIDIYALGIIFYSIMSKKRPHEFIYTNDNYITKKIEFSLKDISLHEELLAIFKWMIEENPKKRPNIVQIKLELINYRNCYTAYY